MQSKTVRYTADWTDPVIIPCRTFIPLGAGKRNIKIAAEESQTKDKKRGRTSILSKYTFNIKQFNYRLLTRSDYSITLSN